MPPAATRLESYDWLDWGRDYYASVSYFGTPAGSRIMQGWMNNWQYAEDIPTSTWRSSMSLPREVTLVSTPEGPRLTQQVVEQLDGQLDTAAAQTRTGVELDGAVDLDLAGEVVKIDAVLRPGDAEQAGITVFGDAESGTHIGYDTDSGRVFVDRRDSGNVGFHPAFASIEDAPVALAEDGTVTLELYLDRASVELFADDGRVTITDQVFPNAGADAITGWSTGGVAVLESITVTPIVPTMWNVPEPPAPTGAAPSVKGSPVVGKTVTADAGFWNQDGLSFSYQWLRDGEPIAGATAQTYRVSSADRGAKLSVQVTATPASGPAGVATSEPVTVKVASLVLGIPTPVVGTTKTSFNVAVQVHTLNGGGTATGEVGVKVNGKTVKGTLQNGKVTVKVGSLPRGVHPIVIDYAGSGTVAASTGYSVIIVIR